MSQIETHYQNKPLEDGTVLVVVSDQPVSLEHVQKAYIATAEQFAQAKTEIMEIPPKVDVIDIGEWKTSHTSERSPLRDGESRP